MRKLLFAAGQRPLHADQIGFAGRKLRLARLERRLPPGQIGLAVLVAAVQLPLRRRGTGRMDAVAFVQLPGARFEALAFRGELRLECS